jgi:membrane protease subunit HflK
MSQRTTIPIHRGKKRNLGQMIDALFGPENPRRGGQLFYLVLGVALIFVLFTSFYTIQPDEQGVVLRFGKYLKTTEPGLHFKLPLGVDEAIKVKTKLILQEEFGFRTRAALAEKQRSGLESESLMLTGDLNVAEVEWIVQFQISDPQKFLFQVRDPVTNVRDIAQAIMRRVVGDRLVTDVLTVGRIEISDEAVLLMQDVLNKYDMGVRIVSIKLQDVNPPEPVKPSFNDVNAAKQEQEQLINQAERRYNEVIPEARGQALKQVAQARGQASALLNRAQGEAAKFSAVLKDYKEAPQLTKSRLYFDAMQEVFAKQESMVLVDERVKGVLPLFQNRKESRVTEQGGGASDARK